MQLRCDEPAEQRPVGDAVGVDRPCVRRVHGASDARQEARELDVTCGGSSGESPAQMRWRPGTKLSGARVRACAGARVAGMCVGVRVRACVRACVLCI
jgi:hypothetical protein